jgi:RNA polymerase sigma factor (sigma-70 family)
MDDHEIDLRETGLTDGDLVDRVIVGFDDAFDELYRRHVTVAWRLAQSVTHSADDAADAVAEAFARVLVAVRDRRLANSGAFRSYLLTATRHAALDVVRRRSRTDAVATGDLDLLTTGAASPADHLDAEGDAALVASAFRDLPERWRSVLWLTEVEGVPTKDAARALGMSPNGAAQLAVRARAGLRDRYLQAHVRADAGTNTTPGDCRYCLDRLGAYVGGGLAARDIAKVDQHLAGCATCTATADELREVGTTLRRIALPLPLGLAALSAERVATALLSPPSVPGLATRAFAAMQEPTPFTRRLVGSAAAGVFGLGVLAAGLLGRGDGGASVADAAAGRAGEPVEDLNTVSSPAGSLGTAALASASTIAPPPVATGAAPTSSALRAFTPPAPVTVPRISLPPATTSTTAPAAAPNPPAPPAGDDGQQAANEPAQVEATIPLLNIPVSVAITPAPSVSVGSVTVTAPVPVPVPAAPLPLPGPLGGK